ncbi:hypothetical protein [Streptomyces sp. cg36]|uniref:hypothetical protein n=1 Tax=Streptomyces sp. cg36 TaxID=3238798 RepID=UPI0034E1B328
MSRFVVIGPGGHDLGSCRRITRDAWSGRILALRCPGCHQRAWVDSRHQIAAHQRGPGAGDVCGLSGLHVVDTAHP